MYIPATHLVEMLNLFSLFCYHFQHRNYVTFYAEDVYHKFCPNFRFYSILSASKNLRDKKTKLIVEKLCNIV